MSRSTRLANPRVVDIAAADPEAVDLLGGKGAGLAGMTREGIPVPPGFVITTEACRAYLDVGAVPDGLYEAVAEHLAALEERAGKSFGAGPHPLLVSVRSGAPVSMPGMMDTVLNLGLSRAAAIALAEETEDTRFMADLVRRFHAMYADTVLGAGEEPSDIGTRVADLPRDADPAATYDLVWGWCAEALMEELGDEVPRDPGDQLRGAIEAVFSSWNNRRARTYRDFHGIPHTLGTAVVVQSMVFGNLDQRSGSGVVFTRNPVDGSPDLFGEFLAASQGEDVVSGMFTPDTIEQAESIMPAAFAELRRLCAELEQARGDVLDIEFTIEREQLYFLQVRSAKRTAEAAVRIADDFLQIDEVTAGQALSGVSVEHVRQIQRPSFDEAAAQRARDEGRLVTIGTGACPGQVSGVLAFDSDEAARLAEDGADVILARPVTSPADLHGMIASRGIVTATGGSTSHAAVVARALGTTCVVGCGELDIDARAGVLRTESVELRSGDEVSLDGASGEFFRGRIPVEAATGRTPHLARVLEHCQQAAGCETFARITLPAQADEVRAAGAQGIVAGLDDILAASGQLDELVGALLRRKDHLDAAALEAVVEREVTPLLAAAEGLDVSLRALDFISDDMREYVQQTPLLTKYPELSLPLGLPGLIQAQVKGLARALRAAGRTSPVVLAIRHVTDGREAAALGRMQRELVEEAGAAISITTYATAARSLHRARALEDGAPISWVELRTLQATHLGLPPRMLLTKEPLESYVRAGLLDLDPRSQLDPGVAELLRSVNASGAGIRLSVPVTEALVGDLYRLGIRRYAVELGDVRPLTIALGKAAAGDR